ncbi:hypothetical protein N0V94_002503 [Neodidymelliopsis sp. IMI 364377]|nr:hypothetical protein N0V94_002503 [Neodidymelliopsis sp. IMI 364377]
MREIIRPWAEMPSTPPSCKTVSFSSWSRFTASGTSTPTGELKASKLCANYGTSPAYNPPAASDPEEQTSPTAKFRNMSITILDRQHYGQQHKSNGTDGLSETAFQAREHKLTADRVVQAVVGQG